MDKKKVLIGVGAVAVIAVAALAIVGAASAKTAAIATEKSQKETLSITVSVSGKTEADDKADVFAPAAGTIARMNVGEGETVKAGEVLAELDASRLAAQIKRAQAGYDAADAQYDAARAVRSVPASVPGAAEQNRQAKAQRAAALAQRKQASIDLDLAKRDRKDVLLRAPMAGIVVFNPIGAGAEGSAQKASEGAAVSPQAPLFTIVRLDSLRLRADVDENDVARIADGDKAKVELDAFPGRPFASSVQTIRPTATATTNGSTAFPVLIPLPAEKGLRIGMSGTAEIAVQSIKDAVTVSSESVFEADGDTFVYVVQDSRLKKRLVKTGASTETRTQIAEGLSAGEEVAVGTGAQLKDGMQVKGGGAR
jgi:RND family efflux transporter MFP subunit